MRLSILYVSFLLVISLVGISALTANPSKAPQSVALQITNRTHAFSVIKAEHGPSELSIILKNNSAKTITAFSISPGKGFTITEEFVFGEISNIGIRPDEVFSKTYSLPSSIHRPSIEIKALILDDGTNEGDMNAVRQIEDSRLGQQIQIRRAVKELQNFLPTGRNDISQFKSHLMNALNASDNDTLNTLLELKPSRINSNQPFSQSLREGLENGRQNVLRNLSEVEVIGSADSFIRLKETYERILSRF